MTDLEMAREIARSVAELGGTTYFVGGYVRDLLRGIENKDIDIEVHGVTHDQLVRILDSHGKRMQIGECFGIFGLCGYHIDIAMPRKECCVGIGHRDFEILVDPYIGTYGAAKRRDFTINALMQNVISGEIVDHFGGREDLNRGILRHVDDHSFAEDPLRVLRCAQFAARFGFCVAEETVDICKKMNLSSLASERVLMELEKAFLKSDKPSVFFDTLRKMNQLRPWFTELYDLIGVMQNFNYHKEGDAYTHTMMVLDAAVAFREKAKDPFAFMLAALCHDFGKASCSIEIDGVIHAYDHEIRGLPIVEGFIKRLTSSHHIREYVLNLVQYHMKPNVMARSKASHKSTNRLFDASVDPEALISLALSDNLGKIPMGNNEESSCFLYDRLQTYRELMTRPCVTGKDLVALGIEPGPRFSEYLAFARKLHLSGIAKDEAMRQMIGNFGLKHYFEKRIQK